MAVTLADQQQKRWSSTYSSGAGATTIPLEGEIIAVFDDTFTTQQYKKTGNGTGTFASLPIEEIYTTTEKSKLSGIATAANAYVHPNHTGDVTSVADGVTTIGALKVVTGMINDGSITKAKISALSVDTSKIEASAISKSKMQNDSVSTPELVDGSVTNAKLAPLSVDTGNYIDSSIWGIKILNNTVSLNKLPTVNQNNFYARSSAGSGDIQIITDTQVKTILGITDFLSIATPATGTKILADSDSNTVLPIDATSAVTVDIPSTLTAGFSVFVYRKTGGQAITVKLAAGSPDTIIGDISASGTLATNIGASIAIMELNGDILIKGDVT